MAEIGRRVFPVPDDLEGVQQYATRGSQLAPGDALTVVDNVTVPLSTALLVTLLT